MKQRSNISLAFALSLIVGTSPLLTLASSGNSAKVTLPSKSDRVLRTPGRPKLINRKPSKNSGQADGQTTTLLPGGRLLLIGGRGPDGQVDSSISDPRNGESILLTDKSLARAWHSATMLPDGRLLIVGGIGANGQVLDRAGIFDPEKLAFQELPKPGVTPRAYHSATLLTDGRVLIVGGVSTTDLQLSRAELWSFKTQISRTAAGRLSAQRAKAKTTLLADGNVLIEGGFDGNGKEIGNSELFNSEAESFNFTTITSEQEVPETPFLTGSLPQDGATEVELDSLIALRFSKPLRVESLKPGTLKLTDEGRTISAKITLAEGGRLAFLLPIQPLQEGITYTVTFSDGTDSANKVTPAVFSFTTTGVKKGESNPLLPNQSMNDVDWAPNAENLRGNWRTKGERSSWQDQPSLQAKPGETALSGQVLTLRGQPLPSVTISVKGRRTRTDHSGRFLVSEIPSGHQVMLIDGRSASRPGATYGLFRAGVDLAAGKTNVLPYTIWMPKLDMAHATTIPSPNKQEIVITNPLIPGLELHLPAGTVIRDLDGQAVTQISITPVPTDRPPFPLPPGFNVPVFASIQPGGARVIPPRARLIYPNYTNERPGARINFWNYDPEGKGWYIYGQGTVTANGKQIIPDPGVVIYEFTGIMIGNGGSPAATGPKPGTGPEGVDGDPVDLGTGLFVLEKTDLVLPDTIPIVLRRTYRPGDNTSRAFGIGSTHPYEMFLWSVNNYQETDLILPDGGRIHYVRVSPGTGWTDAVYEHTATPSAFYKSRISWNGSGWDLKLKDGTLYVIPEFAPLKSIRDRYGNQVTITRSGGVNGNITQITSPNQRWVQFTYDSSNRVTQAKDNIGRTVNYTYDAGGRLWRVTDPNGGVTEYTYDTSNRMLTIKDARGIVYLTNQYDANGRVIRQTQADSSIYQFAYTLDTGGKITQTDVTNPRGNIRRVTFNSDGYTLTNTHALGAPEQRTVTYERQAGTNLNLSVTDPLGRKTALAYDAFGNMTSVTRLADTPNAVATNVTYEPNYNQVASVTDPLNQTTSYAYDSSGKLTSVSDPLNQQSTFTYNSLGQVLTAADPLQQTIQFTYDSGDLVTITDPLNRTVTRTIDAAGRLIQTRNPLGNVRRYVYDNLNQLTSGTDALQGATTFAYDPNGNLLSVTDARNGVTSYTYDNMDRVTTRRDPLLRDETYEHDLSGNLKKVTDRKSQVSNFTYDALERLTQITYADSSTTGYTYDSVNRLTQVVDSLSGTTTLAYDNLDRLTSKTTPQGTISYTYDSAGRRTSMTIAGQTTVNYNYDNANRLTQIIKGSATVTIAYDNANRRTSLTLPNGVVTEYTYDAASQLTGLVYKYGASTLGNLSYSYDAVGRRTAAGGSYARTGLPQAVTSATYNAANQQTAFAGQNLSYDLNGNLTSDGTNTYTWNARNQLASISGGTTASFSYDAFGRRVTRTLSATTTNYFYDGHNIAQELSGTTPIANLLSGGIDEVFTRSESTGTLAPLVDGLGSTIGLSNSSGVVQTQYTYEPFGKTSASGTASTNASQFTGRENDGTALYYYRARYYSPTLQRFISEDPLGFAGGDLNLYAYVGNSPLNFVDPSGQNTLELGVGGSARAGIGVVGSVTIAVDGSGNVGVIYAGGAGAGIAVQANAGILIHASNANTIGDLTGPFANVSGNVGGGADIAGDAFFGRNGDGSPIVGGGVTLGAGVGGGVSTTLTSAGMLFRFNIFDIFKYRSTPSRQPNYPYDPIPSPAPYPTPVGPHLPPQSPGTFPAICPVCAPQYPPGTSLGLAGRSSH